MIYKKFPVVTDFSVCGKNAEIGVRWTEVPTLLGRLLGYQTRVYFRMYTGRHTYHTIPHYHKASDEENNFCESVRRERLYGYKTT